MLKEYVSIDLEMSGLNPKEDRIIEIGAVKIINSEVADTLSVLVNPHRKLSEEIQKLTGLTDEMLAAGAEDYEAVRRLLEFAEGRPFVGHHIISDVSFIKSCGINHGFTCNNKVVDTLGIARKLLPPQQKKNLGALCEYAKINEETKHRAVSDAMATHRLLQWMMHQPEVQAEWFEPRELDYKVKKQGPITKAQIRQLTELLEYHQLEMDIQIGSLTKNEASRKIDKIIFNYGRIPKA